MLTFRPTILFSLALSLLTTAVMAGGGLPKPTCHSCSVGVRDCNKNCLNNHNDDKAYEVACQAACKCHVGKQNKFCRESCGLSGDCQVQLGGEEILV